MSYSSLIAAYLLLFASQFVTVICDGNHAHAHEDGGAATSATSSTVHTTSSEEGQEDTLPSLLSGISPEILSSLAANPQIAQALRGSGFDVGAGAAAAAAADAGGAALPRVGGVGGLPGGFPGGYPGGFPGGFGGLGGIPFPFFGGGKNLHVSGNFGLYYPYIEKIVIIVGGSILLLVILALLTKGLAKGGLLFNMGSSISQALSGAASVDIGPFHKSVAGASAISAGAGSGQRIGSSPQDMQLTQNVYNGLDQRF